MKGVSRRDHYRRTFRLHCGKIPHMRSRSEDVYLGSRDKIADLNDFCRKYSLERAEILYVGDDVPDIEATASCGIGVAPADGVQEAKDAADYVSEFQAAVDA